MAYIGKTYKHERDENFDGFIASLGIPADRAEMFKNFKPSHELKKNGDTYILVSNDKAESFQSGVEYDAVAPGGSENIKSVVTVDGNTTTQVQKFSDGRSITFKREYSPDQLIVTITTSFWDGKATRYYKAV